MVAITHADIVNAPKALLHDHLDGGLRPATIVELAAEIGHDLPETDPARPGDWFVAAADSGSLARYLERGLSLDAVVDAVHAGFREGCAEAAAQGHHIRIGTLLTAMRHAARSQEIAELAVRYRDTGVVGFDIAGAEAGFPPTRHLDAFEYLQRENFHFTIHAGEAFGLPSIWQAIQWCGADRLGHGVRIVDDITGTSLGRLSSYVRDKRIPLELCPSSNVQTGAAPSIAEHPIGLLHDLRFRVTVNTDNRLMSGTSMSREMTLLSEAFGWGWSELQWLTINAMKSAFIPYDERLTIINEDIKPAYAKLIG